MFECKQDGCKLIKDAFDPIEVQDLERISFQEIRPNILRAIFNAEKSGHPAGSFSIVEIVVVLYEKLLRIAPGPMENAPFRDVFILGCGHNSPALYSMLGRKKFFNLEQFIEQYRKTGLFSGHPKVNVPGVEIGTGSLGNAISAAVEWASMIQKKPGLGEPGPKVYFLDGNAGFEEGITHEALQVAAQRKITNLVYIINDNGFTLDNACNYPYNYADTLSSYGFHVLGRSIDRSAIVKCIEPDCDSSSVLFGNKRTDYYINGNSIESVWKTLIQAKRIIESGQNKGPVAIVFNTVKGFGHERMAGDNNFHAKVPGLSVEKGIEGICRPENYKVVKKAAGKRRKTLKKIGSIVAELSKEHHNLYIMSADTGSSTGVIQAENVAPERYIEIGCREQHLVLGTIGYERCGYPVIACTFSQYLSNRAREQIITVAQHFRLCRAQSSVILLGTHTGLSSGKDDMSHHCIDLYSLGAIPKLNLMHAADVDQLGKMLRYALDNIGLYYIAIEKEAEINTRQNKRYEYHDGRFIEVPLQEDRTIEMLNRESDFGHPLLLKKGRHVLIITSGLRTYDAMDAAEILQKEGVSVGVAQLPTISPLNENVLMQYLGKIPSLLIVEENCRQGGLGESLIYMLCRKGIPLKNIRHLFLNDYSHSDAYNNLLKNQGLDVETIVKEAIWLAARTGALFTPYKNSCMRMMTVPAFSPDDYKTAGKMVKQPLEVSPAASATQLIG